MPSCCVKNCYNSYHRGGLLMYFTLPKEEDRKKKWIEFLGEDVLLKANPRTCEVHFDNDQWIKKSVKLKPDAVPTLKCSTCPDKARNRRGLVCRGHPLTASGKSYPEQERDDHIYTKIHSKRKDLEYSDGASNFQIYHDGEISAEEPQHHNEHPYCKPVLKHSHISATQTCADFPQVTKTVKTQIVFPQVISDNGEAQVVSNSAAVKGRCSLRTKAHIIFPKVSFFGSSENENSENLGKNLVIKRDIGKVAFGKLNAKITKLKKELAETKRALKKAKNDKRLIWLEKNFSKAQILAATTGNSRGRKWSVEDLKVGLEMRSALGKRGYQKAIKEWGVPLPSYRTLSRRPVRELLTEKLEETVELDDESIKSESMENFFDTEMDEEEIGNISGT